MENIEIAGTYRAQWGEGPIWWENRLLYVDIEAQSATGVRAIIQA